MEKNDKIAVTNQFKIFDNMLEGIAIYELIFNDKGKVVDGVLKYVNQAAVKTTDLNPEDAIGKTATKLFDLDYVKSYNELINEYRATGKYKRLETYYSPTDKYFLISGFDMHDNLFAILRIDITEQKKAEDELSSAIEKLNRDEERLELAQHAADIGMFEWDILTGVNIWTPQLEAMYGLSPGEFGGTEEAWEKLVYPPDFLKAQKMVEHALETGELVEGDWRVMWPDGSIHWIFGRFQAFKDKSGKPIRLTGANIDVTERKKAEKLLKESEEKFRSFYELSLIGISVNSPDKSWIEANDKLCEILGYSREELFKTTWDKITYPDDLNKDLEQFNKLINGYSDSYTIEKRFIRKDGSVVYTNISVGLIRNEDNSVKYSVGFMEDISSRKKAEEELRQARDNLEEQVEKRTNELKNAYKELEDREKSFSSLLLASSEVLYHVSPDWNVMLHLNSPGFLANTEKPNRTWLQEYVPPEDQPNVIAVFNEAILTKSVYELEHRVIQSDGSRGWVFSRAIPIIDEKGEIVEWFGAASDITERKKAENELKKALNDIKRSNEELEQFAHVASHDLQEPLRTVASFTQLLERRYKGKLDSDADEFMEYIVDAAVRMKQQIQDLLEYSRVATVEKEFTQVNTNSILNQVINNLKNAIDKNNAEITHDPLPNVIGDNDQLRRVFQNLIGNAIKYRKPAESPKIHISAHEDKEKDEYVFSVSDNGIGIEKKYLDRIFIVFQRLHTKDEYKGTGVGLSVVKKVIERQGGRIWVESELGKGSTFYFTIPVKG